MLRWGRITIVLTALTVAASAAPALAHDHRRPKVVLRSHGETQRAQVWSYGWTRQDGKFCASVVSDGIPNYRRRAMAWNPDNPLHLYFYKRQEPEKVRVRTYRRLDDDGFPAGNGRRARVTLRRKVLDSGRRIWIGDFTAPDRRRLYIDALAAWEDVEGCGGTQYLDMAFHIRRR